ncbi:MAG TPA: efflux transporter outer membrane subunit [Usitatibacter sp.]|nr:efflux transporter outer membrane subunit [Usitatibacter sp.]
MSAFLVVGCTVGPDYRRPEVELPATYGVAQSTVPAPERWWVVFMDPALDKLVEEALAANHDLKAAAERVEQARALVGIARSDMFPDAGIEAERSRNRASERGSFPLPPEAIETNTYRLGLRASWELDFWGKFRRATEAARAELAASEAGREAIRASLVGDVTRGYFALRALDGRIEAVTRTLTGRQKATELQKLRFDAGMVSELEYRQVESEQRVTESLLPPLRQAVVRQEGALALLLGRGARAVLAASVERGVPALPLAVDVPAGLPSDLLLRRPDLREAEARLHAANARIGVARAAYFPSITLTGYFGGESQSLSDIFSGAARTWNVAGGLLQPLFASSAIRGNHELANARTREAEQLYRKAIANAFREVREAIHAQSNARDALAAQQARVDALSRTVELARLRYDNGAVSLFEVLEAERQLVLARLDFIDAERDRRTAIVDLYLALGA